jgi:hypothetical protein
MNQKDCEVLMLVGPGEPVITGLKFFLDRARRRRFALTDKRESCKRNANNESKKGNQHGKSFLRHDDLAESMREFSPIESRTQ